MTKNFSQEIGKLPSIRTHLLQRHLVTIWCICECLAWCHSIIFALNFQQRGKLSTFYNGFSRYLPLCLSTTGLPTDNDQRIVILCGNVIFHLCCVLDLFNLTKQYLHWIFPLHNNLSFDHKMTYIIAPAVVEIYSFYFGYIIF